VICDTCAYAADNEQRHAFCRGKTWCDCQHLDAPQGEPDTEEDE
jgi:hypothetical protein